MPSMDRRHVRRERRPAALTCASLALMSWPIASPASDPMDTLGKRVRLHDLLAGTQPQAPSQRNPHGQSEQPGGVLGEADIRTRLSGARTVTVSALQECHGTKFKKRDASGNAVEATSHLCVGPDSATRLA